MNIYNINLSFSGGGFRATFYCVGAYRRLVELGIHNQVSNISSVSGGSIAAGAIMMGLAQGKFTDIVDFDKRVTTKLIEIGQSNLRNKIFKKAILPFRALLSNAFPQVLAKELFGDIKMIDLPTVPEWSCNTTCLNTLKRFRFKVTDIYGNLLGKSTDIKDITVAYAVAASAAFPLMFAPMKFINKERKFFDEYNSSVYKNRPEILYLTDGGVYDNLGSEKMLRGDGPFFILDASASGISWKSSYAPSYFQLNKRILQVSLEQVVLLRRRLLYLNNQGIQLLINTPINKIFKSEQKLRKHYKPLPHYPEDYYELEEQIASLRTDLDSFHDFEIEALMWSGAIRMDLAVKSLLPKLIPEDKWADIPLVPLKKYDQWLNIVSSGKKRVYLRSRHKSLHS